MTATLAESDTISRVAQERPGAHQDWAEFIGRHLGRFSIRTRREPSFKVGARIRGSGDFMAARFSTVSGQAQLARGKKEIGLDGHDRYALYLPLKGEHQLSQIHRDSQCGVYSMSLVTLAEPLVHTKLGDNDTVYLLLPRSFVDQRLACGENICARAVAAETGVQRLARDTVMTLQREAELMSPQDFEAASRAAGDLILLAMAGSADLMSTASPVRAGNLARAKRVIRARLSDPDLTLDDVARECGLSLRYLHDLFRDDGRTASAFLLGERLERSRRMLESGNGRLITDVSMTCGFSSPSQFATAFRRVFGMSPRDVARRA